MKLRYRGFHIWMGKKGNLTQRIKEVSSSLAWLKLGVQWRRAKIWPWTNQGRLSRTNYRSSSSEKRPQYQSYPSRLIWTKLEIPAQLKRYLAHTICLETRSPNTFPTKQHLWYLLMDNTELCLGIWISRGPLSSIVTVKGPC